MALWIIVPALVIAGVFFMVVAAVGFVRLPDLFCRLHVTGVLDTLGAPLVLLAVALHCGPGLSAVKIVIALAFLFITSPLVGHLLSRAALEAGYTAPASGAVPPPLESSPTEAP